MRAARLEGWRAPLVLASVPDPAPPANGVVLRVLACGICRSDWHVWVGADPDVSLPHIPGHEFCGEIVATGPGVTRWQVGERVIAPFILACGACPACAAGHQTTCPQQVLPGFSLDGAFAEYVAVAHADANLTRLPEALPVTHAAAMGCRVTTAWHALTGRAALAPGEWLAVWGAGGVGLSTLLLARAMGARVVLIDVVAEKLRHAEHHGATASVDASATDPVEAVREITGGGAHVALEALGIAETTGNALKSLRKLGRLVQVGMPAGEEATMTLPWDAVYSGQLAVYGTRGMPAHRFSALFDLIAAQSIDLAPLVARHVPLSAASAELAVFDGPAPPGVAVITDFSS